MLFFHLWIKRKLKGMLLHYAIAIYIRASAIIWGAVIIGCALKLKGTPCFGEISLILSGGATFHLLFIILWQYFLTYKSL